MSVNTQDLIQRIFGQGFAYIPPLPTLWHSKGHIDAKAMCCLADYVKAHVQALFVGGTTGRLPFLNAEYVSVLVRIVKQSETDLAVFAGVKGRSSRDVLKFIEGVSKADPDAVVVPHPYYAIHDLTDLSISFPKWMYTEHFKEVFSGSKGIPKVIYDIPGLCSNRDIPLETTDALLEQYSEDLIAEKYSNLNLEKLTKLTAKQNDHFKVLQGIGCNILESALGGWIDESGAQLNDFHFSEEFEPVAGAVPATVALFPKLFDEIRTVASGHDLEKAWNLRNTLKNEIYPKLYGRNFCYMLAGLAYGLACVGIGSGCTPEPFKPLKEQEKEAVFGVVQTYQNYLGDKAKITTPE